MFEKYMICQDGFQNVEQEGRAAGFSLQLRVPYYRGIYLSIVHDVIVWVDGEKYTRGDMKFTADGDTFTLAEMETAVNHRWGFGDKAVLSVAKEGGLASGRHHVAVELQLRISYLPWISVNKFEQDMVLE